MSRATSIAGVRPLGWLARLRAQRSCLVWASAQRSCLAEMARALGPITALGMGSRDDHARQRSGFGPRVVQTDTFARAQEERHREDLRRPLPKFDPVSTQCFFD